MLVFARVPSAKEYQGMGPVGVAATHDTGTSALRVGGARTEQRVEITIESIGLREVPGLVSCRVELIRVVEKPRYQVGNRRRRDAIRRLGLECGLLSLPHRGRLGRGRMSRGRLRSDSGIVSAHVDARKVPDYAVAHIQSATRSAIMMQVRLMFARGMVGITDASTTRNCSTP